MSSGNYTVRLSRSADLDAIASLVERHYILEEPIARSYLSNRGDDFTQEEIQDMTANLRTLFSAYPCLVVVKDDVVVGTVILEDFNGVGEDKSTGSSLDELNNGVMGIVRRLSLFERFPQAKKVVKLRMMTVDGEHRGRGLATLMLREAVDWARKNEVDLLWSLFNAPASLKAAEKVGFELVEKYDLVEFRDSSGKQLFGAIPERVSYAMVYRVKK